MLSIRTEQLEAFSALTRTEFIDRLVTHLTAEYPEWFAELPAPHRAREFVDKAIGFGEAHGIRGRWSVTTLVELLVEFGEGFAGSPDRAWALEIVTHAALPDRLKMTLLVERLRARTGGRRIVEIEAGAVD
jgi:hypothetical protein